VSVLGVNIGLKSLLAAQASLETIGHNISNANTPGYSRQAVQVSTSSPMRLRGLVQGTGLQADVISRTVDALLHGRITSQVAALGRIDARLDMLSNVESFLGGASDTGTPALFKKMFQAWASLSTAPEDSILRTGAVQSAASVATGLNQLATKSTTLARDVFLRLRTNTDQVNQIVRRIGELNTRASRRCASCRASSTCARSRTAAARSACWSAAGSSSARRRPRSWRSPATRRTAASG
jgi:flagellar hook-associated protein 1 FlgK